MPSEPDLRLHLTISWPETSKLQFNAPFWAAALERLKSHCDFAALTSVGMRLTFMPGSRIETSYVFGGLADQGRALAAEMAGYDGIDGVRVSVATHGGQRTSGAMSPGSVLVQPQHEGLLCADGSAIYMRVDVASLLPHLMDVARRAGIPLEFRFVSRAFRSARELVRQLHHNLIALQQIGGLPAELYTDQQEIVARVQAATFLADDCFVLNKAITATAAIVSSLEGAMRATVYSRYGSIPPLSQIGSTRTAAFAELRHCEHDLPAEASRRPLVDIVGKTVQSADILDRIERFWIATAQGASMRHEIDVGIAGREIRPSEKRSRASFVFISYARANEQEMLCVLRGLEANGLACWIDRQIHAAGEWDTELESRIAACAGFVAIVTRDYLKSKICVREIKFADRLGKPIIPLVEPGVELSDGLDLLLSSTQLFYLGDPRIIDKVRSAVPRPR